MTACYLSPIGNSPRTTTSGAPLSGGTISFFLAGTNTPAVTYTDSTGSTPQALSITLNTYGLPASPIWLQGGQAYKAVIKDSLGNSIPPTYDGIYGIGDPAAGAGPAMSFRNRLVNGNFSINQRSVSGAVTLGAGTYGHDRWKAGAAGCTYTFAVVGNSAVITITAGSLIQVVEAGNVEGGVYTLVNQGTAQARYGINGAAPSGTYVTASAASPLQLASANANQTVSVEFSTGTLDRVQLEPGTVATTFERRPLEVELARCQRRCVRWSSASRGDIAVGLAYDPTHAAFALQLPVPMASTPTVTSTALTVTNGAGTQIGGTSSGISNFTGMTINLSVGVSAGLTAGQASILSAGTGAGGFLQLECEL